ncbi:MAG: O-antigen ligase family protein [Rhizomicrobium sp.]
MNDEAGLQDRAARYFRLASLWLLVLTMAWAPFPLGSAVSWGAPLLEVLVAASLVLWAASTIADPGRPVRDARVVAIPALLALPALAWVAIQTVPIVPQDWAHPIWGVAATALQHPNRGLVSIDPWRTRAELLKLSCYVAAFWVAFSLSRRVEHAQMLLVAFIAIAAAYALYAFALAGLHVTQVELIYALPLGANFITGPFMLHNSFATYAGLGTVAAAARLFASADETIVADRGPRQFLLTAMHFIFDRGALMLVAAILLFSAVVASASRAGFGATAIALMVLGLIAALRRRSARKAMWPAAVTLIVVVPLFGVILSNGGLLAKGFAELADAGGPDAVRLALWDAAWRMIADRPWLGTGLGTFQDAYPLYAVKVLPFVMDKAHCDYLEFAAGAGIPAMVAWCAALAWLGVRCAAGALTRRRHQVFALVGLGTLVLVAVHATVDFSLQIPAVALSFAVLLGAGVAQSLRSQGKPSAATAAMPTSR